MSAYKIRRGLRWAPWFLAGVAVSLLMTATGTAQDFPSEEEPAGDTEPEESPDEQRSEASAAAEYPDLCSDTQPALYTGDCQTLQDGFVEKYKPKYQLWADGERKERFIHLDGTIDATNENNWEFPSGTILYKTFLSRAGQRFETRIIKKVANEGRDTDWSFATWGWKSDGTAQAVTASGSNWQSTGHNIPTLKQCDSCHRPSGKGAAIDPILGFTAIQLNHDGVVTNDDNESDTTDSNSVLTLSGLGSRVSSDLTTRAAIPGEEATQQALGYLYANCSHCHGGPKPAGGGLNLSLPLGLSNVGNTPAWQTAVCKDLVVFSPPDELASSMTQRIQIGDALESSAVLWRMQTRVPGDGMPPLATTQVHPVGVQWVRSWIETITSCDPATAR